MANPVPRPPARRQVTPPTRRAIRNGMFASNLERRLGREYWALTKRLRDADPKYQQMKRQHREQFQATIARIDALRELYDPTPRPGLLPALRRWINARLGRVSS